MAGTVWGGRGAAVIARSGAEGIRVAGLLRVLSGCGMIVHARGVLLALEREPRHCPGLQRQPGEQDEQDDSADQAVHGARSLLDESVDRKSVAEFLTARDFGLGSYP